MFWVVWLGVLLSYSIYAIVRYGDKSPATISAVAGSFMRIDSGVLILTAGVVGGLLIHFWYAGGQ